MVDLDVLSFSDINMRWWFFEIGCVGSSFKNNLIVTLYLCKHVNNGEKVPFAYNPQSTCEWIGTYGKQGRQLPKQDNHHNTYLFEQWHVV